MVAKWGLWLVLFGSAVAAIASADRGRFRNMNDGGVMLLELDGGVFLRSDGGPFIIPMAPAIRCGADARPLLSALNRYRCKQSQDCVVRELDLSHQAIPPCIAATGEAWRSKDVGRATNALAQECGFETNYGRGSCPAASCRRGLCILERVDSGVSE